MMNTYETLQQKLRRQALTLRTNGTPLKDLIPLLNQAADRLDKLEDDVVHFSNASGPAFPDHFPEDF